MYQAVWLAGASSVAASPTDGLMVALEYAEPAVDAATAEALMASFQQVLGAVLDDPSVKERRG